MKYLVLDEADTILAQQKDAMLEVFQKLPKKVIASLFSSTFDNETKDILYLYKVK